MVGHFSSFELKEFYLLKSDARFVHYFINKFNIDTDKDNTPNNIKTATRQAQVAYLHGLVAECLIDLLPYFKDTSNNTEDLVNHPLQGGTIHCQNTERGPVSPGVHEVMGAPASISQVDAEEAVKNVTSICKETIISNYLKAKTVEMSSKRTKNVYCCVLCHFESKYKAVCLNHIESCVTKLPGIGSSGGQVGKVVAGEAGYQEEGSEQACYEATAGMVDDSGTGKLHQDTDEGNRLPDMFFNYKNAEFFFNSMFAVTTIFEKYGDGVGCLIVSKIFLPIFHALHHSNYSCSVHRFITRVLSEATPREALKLVHERFSNRSGKPGRNVFRDRRMEFRIGMIKKLIGNLGPNFSAESVKQVNHMVDIKEELYSTTRLSHGVIIRSGRHVPRSDAKDFQLLIDNLTKTEAHVRKPGRVFGSFEFPENILDDEKFDKAQFYRWIAEKNLEARDVEYAKQKM